MRRANRRATGDNGLTLVELVVAVAIVALLAAVAYPSYQRYRVEARRSLARVALQEVISREERHYVDLRRYAALDSLGYAAATVGIDAKGDAVVAGKGLYDLSLAPEQPSGGVLVQAVATGAQRTDAECLVLRLDGEGRRTPAGCW